MAGPLGDETLSRHLLRAFASSRSFLKSNLSGNCLSATNVAMEENGELLSKVGKQELTAKLLSTLIGLAASFGITYFALKWLSNVMDPTHKERKSATARAQKMLQLLGVKDVKLSDHELCIAANLVDPLSVSVDWKDIGGLEEVVEQIKETVIFPFRRRDLFMNSSLLQSPKGVLFYGPPGCGKTMLAKATAKSAGARFINLQISSLVDKWYGESQKRAEAVFSLAIKLQPSIIFIDEIDSFLRARQSHDHEATAMMKTQFMSLWDGIITDPNSQIMVIGATNRPQDVDAAILRRMPCMIQINKPEKIQRSNILKIILEKEQVEDLDFKKLGEITENFCGSDLKEACRLGALNRVHEVLQTAKDNMDENFYDAQLPQLRKISMADLEYAVAKVKESKHLTSWPVLPPLD
ncbi:outer mitochondrial transmembrane helix translocase-like [Ylistrum balloti]|uniref:outer mitochondrial transmembrane helix translocase-like n=1 Tax=Ylistrum balloti TaxID=509963 RepID=UPI002905CE64|nr:outer mitochondrial transmembrane helix translocase-like [Ylistrum balloti]